MKKNTHPESVVIRKFVSRQLSRDMLLVLHPLWGIRLSHDSFPPNPPTGMIRPGEQTVNGLKDAYVESVIKKAIAGRLTTGQAAAKIPPKTVVDIYITRSGKRVAAFDGRLWALVAV